MKNSLFKPKLPDDHRVDELKKLKEALDGRANDTPATKHPPVQNGQDTQE